MSGFAQYEDYDALGLAQLVRRAYEQIANGLSQQAKGSALNAVA